MNWNKIGILSFVIITAVVIAGSILLPEKVITNNDKNIVDKINVENTQKIESISEKTSLYENIDILQRDSQLSGTTELNGKISIDVGINIKNANEAIQICKKQIGILEEYDFPNFEIADAVSESASGNLIIDGENPSKYVIIWEVVLETEIGKCVFYLEDQYHKIVFLECMLNDEYRDKGLQFDIFQLADYWAEYTGLKTVELKSSDTDSITMSEDDTGVYGTLSGIYEGEDETEYYILYQFYGYEGYISITYHYYSQSADWD